jgi:ABC-2 type transport system ATP-binding protein
MQYSGFTLGPIDLSIAREECVGLVGPNGSGKSTLLGCSIKLRRPSSGSVNIGGTESLPLGQGELGIVKEAHLPGGLSGADLLALEKQHIGAFDEERAISRLKAGGIDRTKRIDRLSLGQVTFLQWVIALSRNPKYFILDEPFTGLDPIARHNVISWLAEARSKSGSGYVLSSHSLIELDLLVDRIVFLDSGRILADIVKPARHATWWHCECEELSGARPVNAAKTIWIGDSRLTHEPPAKSINLDDVFHVLHSSAHTNGIVC